MALTLSIATALEMDHQYIRSAKEWIDDLSLRPGAAAVRPDASNLLPYSFHMRNLLEDIAVWGWAEAPAEQLVFGADDEAAGKMRRQFTLIPVRRDQRVTDNDGHETSYTTSKDLTLVTRSGRPSF